MPRKNTRKQPQKKRVYFKILAPEAREVHLCGTFNNWEVDARCLKKGSNGDWRTFLSLEPGVYEYRFLVDGEWADHTESEMVPNAFGTKNCVRVVG